MICALCGKEIKGTPVPYYQGKRKSEKDPKMWRCESCPKIVEAK